METCIIQSVKWHCYNRKYFAICFSKGHGISFSFRLSLTYATLAALEGNRKADLSVRIHLLMAEKQVS